MNPDTNPYAPGAGMPPPELAGREELLSNAKTAIRRTKSPKVSARSLIYVGLRGVGKTVLLNEIQHYADSQNCIADMIEASKTMPLSKALIATLRAALLKLDRQKGVSEKVKRGLRILQSFIATVKVTYADVDISLDLEPEQGVADSGDLTRDLPELFVAVGEAARSRDSSVVILIDEIQNLPMAEFEALIMAVHRVNQQRLPVLVIGAGLPLLVRLSGEAKSYAERLFEYPEIGPLSPEEATRALVDPAAAEGVAFDGAAVQRIIEATGGYPYFIQEWAYQAWNIAKKSPITLSDIELTDAVVMQRLDANFFRSRYDRLTETQKLYLRAMAEIGDEPLPTGIIAKALGKKSQQVGPVRDALIQSGMIYAPKYGQTAFTVPLFGGFMRRIIPIFQP
jgi:type II secretory pathway predicted ATPase ExeA